MEKTKVIILIGPPCSGKSTWSKRFIKSNSSYIRVNRDDIRRMLNAEYKMVFDQEVMITKIIDDIIIRASNAGKNIIIDNTNCRAKYITDIISKHSEHSYNIKIFNQSLYTLKIRNIIRYIKTGVWIPIHVINRMYAEFELLSNNLAKNLDRFIHKIEKVDRDDRT